MRFVNGKLIELTTEEIAELRFRNLNVRQDVEMQDALFSALPHTNIREVPVLT